ncbi:MAG: class I SAM-dependent methyltransferase [Bauldia sp.]|nr:class I SAM-dependent methyltransferase [Bauldia sp.]
MDDNVGTVSLSEFAATWGPESENPFLDRYAGLDLAQWEEKSVAAIKAPVQDGIRFPAFPPDDLQLQMHGQAGEPALREVFHFHRVVAAYCRRMQLGIGRDTTVLEFGTGWGRGLRPLMAKVSLRNLYGYETTPTFCRVARMLNPYVTIVNGRSVSPTPFAAGCFDLVFSLSTFAHMPRHNALAWLQEFARILRPGALLFITFWGERFIAALKEAERAGRSGGAVHWFHEQVLREAGEIEALEQRCKGGEVVFIPSGQYPDWGNTFVSPQAAQNLQVDGMTLVGYDASLLPQDLVVFRRASDT